MAASQGMSLPPLMAYPPPEVRQTIQETDWAVCVTSWNAILKLHLVLPKTIFAEHVTSTSSLVGFITTYVDNVAHEKDQHASIEQTQTLELRQNVFRCLHRIISEFPSLPAQLLIWTFLGNACRIYDTSGSLKTLLSNLWSSHRSTLEESLAPLKASLIEQLGSKSASVDEAALTKQILPLMHASNDASLCFMTGSDLLDSISAGYGRVSSNARSRLVVFVFLGLSALMDGATANHSLLMDHLYSLKEASEKIKTESSISQSLISDLVIETPFVSRLKKRVVGKDSSRRQNIITSLEIMRQNRGSRPKKHVRRKIDKGKSKAADDFGHQAMEGVHVHRMSLITQVQDLFADLGSGFVVKLLDYYKDDVEQVIAHLLDESLPASLSAADRTEQLPSSHMPEIEIAERLAPRATPPPSPPQQRRNVFDDDDFDRLAVKSSSLLFGRKNKTVSADRLLDEPGDRTSSKAAIMSALAAFDADDDERDDTYDVSDVGGTVDSARPGGADEADADINDMREKNEEALFSAFKMSPDAFERDAATRRGQARQALKSETGMTDEAIEGWAVMVRRDPRRMRRLEMKYTTFGGDQRALASTKWQDGPDGSTENSEASGPEGSGRGRGRGRGRGHGRGRGGHVAGPSNDQNTQQARDRKEQNKGSRANHNRRDQRARKMARGGLPG